MVKALYKFFFQSPWDDPKPSDNIFTNRRQKKYPQFFDDFNINMTPDKIIMALAGIFLLWIASGIYKVQEGEEAVIMRFGKFVRKGEAGLNYHLPAPFEKAIIESVNKSRRIEIGYRSAKGYDAQDYASGENLMLTGDQNIINLNADVMWHIKDVSAFVLNVSSPEDTIKAASESAIREIVGITPIASILSNQKQEIALKIEKLIQEILDNYKAGVAVEKVQLLKAEPPAEVIDAYRDVQTSKADKERSINQAHAYSNDVLPKARGEAEKMIQEAEGYKSSTISRAQGDVSRFNAVMSQYNNSKQVTRDRLYLETAESVLTGSRKTIIESGTLPHMNIDK
ncbi:MAG: FtsH protease activity modulator HflK [Rickettsiaceae bacterium]|nr:FtsH protease activity modulator HflK [Rickettsiaceae bacterium]